MNAEYKDRVEHWIRTLRDDFYEPVGEIHFAAHTTMEQIPLSDAEKLEYRQVEPGWKWGRTYEYCWLKGEIVLPKEAEGERIVLDLRPGYESCVFVNGREFGTVRNSWVTTRHHYLVDNVITSDAKSGEKFEILLETYAGQYYPEAPSLDNATGPVLPGSYQNPVPEGERVTLGRSTFGIWNEEAYQLYLDVTTLRSLWKTLDETSLRAAKIEEGLEEFTRIVDFEQDRALRIRDYRKAREALKPLLEAHNGSTRPTFYAVGNAHIDLAWLWPVRETERKAERTFAAQLRHLEECPEYRFLQSQPALYEMCRRCYPDLFRKIKEAAREGRWIPEGAMWVEPDTNLPSGESLVRQLLYGKAYFWKEFGVDSEILWLPDSFGYSGALPQLLKDAGVKYLVTQKIFWSYNEGEEFPYHYFAWEGIDGTSVTAFLPTSYTYQTTPEEIENVWKKRRQRRDLDSFLLPFGYGDGGGGPTRDHIEYALRQKDLEGGAAVEMKGPNEFFHDLEKKGGPSDTWSGELYFSAHRGTFTTQAKVKANNRHCEAALRELEFWNALATAEGGKAPCQQERIEELWKGLLLNQFHDILPGSGIARIYEDARREVEEVIRGAKEAAREVFRALAADRKAGRDRLKEKSAEDSEGNTPVVSVMNSQGFARTEIVELPEEMEGSVVTGGGEILPVIHHKVRVHVPAAGSVVLRSMKTGISPSGMSPGQKRETDSSEMPQGQAAKTGSFGAAAGRKSEVFPGVTAEQDTEGNWILANDRIRVIVNGKGEVVSYIRKESGREFAKEPLNHFRLFKDIPRKYDAWDIDSNYEENEVEALTEASVTFLEQNDLEAVLLLTGKLPNADSALKQKIVLQAGQDQLRFETDVDWKALHRLLKVSFPVDVRTFEGVNEIQYGYVKRPTTRSRMYDKERFEVCNHRYTALFDGAHGAAVLNESKYGISMEENRMELSLLRAAAAPQMRADNERQQFTYAFTAWEGSFEDSRVVQEAIALNEPLQVVPGAIDVPGAVAIDASNIILDAMKLAEDGTGDIILRLYEAKHCDTNAKIRIRIPGTIVLCSILETQKEDETVSVRAENGMQEVFLHFAPFQVRTLRVGTAGRKQNPDQP